MHRAAAAGLAVPAAGTLLLLLAGCSSMESGGSGFARVRPVLESNCVHCHGTNRLAHMAAFDSTDALSRLIGPNNWIVPGHPERSRFFQVVTFSDAQPGAMPPTGHAIARAEVDALRVWILSGAQLPEQTQKLRPRGEAPRSR